MTIIRKFFDAAAAEPTAAPSIAELMAKHGTKSDSGYTADIPVIQPGQSEKKEEPTPASEAAAPAKGDESSNAAATATPETPTPAPVETPKPEPQKETTPEKPQQTWQEVLKNSNVQPDAVLKELGYDDKVVQFFKEWKDVDPRMSTFLNHWREGKDLTAYLRELTTDYSKMAAEDVMRHQLRADYPTASPQQIEALYKRQVVNAYSLDSNDAEELAEGKLLLEAQADRHRATLTANQQNYLFPKPPEPKAPEPDKQAQQQQREFETYQSFVEQSPLMTNMMSSRNLTVGDGENKMNYPVDPSIIKELLFNPDKWTEKLFDVEQKPDGTKRFTPNVERLMLNMAFTNDPKGFLQAHADHWQAIGAKSIIAPIENAKQPDGSQPAATEVAPKSAAEAMARYGKLS